MMQSAVYTPSEYSVAKHLARFVPVKGWALAANGTLQRAENNETATTNGESASGRPQYFYVANTNTVADGRETTKVAYRIYR